MAGTTEELGPRWQTERCPECAFDPNGVGPAELPAAVAGLGRRYQAPLTRFLPGEDESLLVAHPLPGVWSALAYACHVRDVLAVFDGRIARMLAEDAPDLGWWDHEAAVEADAYEKEPPARGGRGHRGQRSRPVGHPGRRPRRRLGPYRHPSRRRVVHHPRHRSLR